MLEHARCLRGSWYAEFRCVFCVSALIQSGSVCENRSNKGAHDKLINLSCTWPAASPTLILSCLHTHTHAHTALCVCMCVTVLCHNSEWMHMPRHDLSYWKICSVRSPPLSFHFHSHSFLQINHTHLTQSVSLPALAVLPLSLFLSNSFSVFWLFVFLPLPFFSPLSHSPSLLFLSSHAKSAFTFSFHPPSCRSLSSPSSSR